MFKKTLVMTLVVAFFLIFVPKGTYAAASPSLVDKSSLQKGIITVNYTNSKGSKAIVRVTKGHVKYDYNLVEGAQYPLQLGDGNYNVLIAESVSNNKYKVVAQENIELKMENENVVFLQSIPHIDWNSETKAVVEAKKLTVDALTEADKVAAIYLYITENFNYDYDKAQTVEAGYTPNLDEVYDASQGICYDFAAIFAAMARSEGIPTRLVMGYEVNAPDTYHAWNQVFLKDSNEWVTIDTTYDASRIHSGQATPMMKDPANYTITKIY